MCARPRTPLGGGYLNTMQYTQHKPHNIPSGHNVMYDSGTYTVNLGKFTPQ